MQKIIVYRKTTGEVLHESTYMELFDMNKKEMRKRAMKKKAYISKKRFININELEIIYGTES